MKPTATLSAFGGMLSLVATKAMALASAIELRDESVPRLSMQMRGALDVVEVGISEARRTLDTIDGGGE